MLTTFHLTIFVHLSMRRRDLTVLFTEEKRGCILAANVKKKIAYEIQSKFMFYM